MIPVAIQHQFEFWSHLGQVGGYFRQYEGFSSLSPKDATWPSKVFNLQEQNIKNLKEDISKYQLSNSVAIGENKHIESTLKAQVPG